MPAAKMATWFSGAVDHALVDRLWADVEWQLAHRPLDPTPDVLAGWKGDLLVVVRACCLISACDSQARHPRLCFDAVNEDADGGPSPTMTKEHRGPWHHPVPEAAQTGDMLSVPARC